MAAAEDYCSYTKAVEHLGDRWSLLILRELGLHGPRGFNAIVDGLPGVSRSVLARRLRKLEDIGLIARDASVPGRHAPYRLAPAGQQLGPTLYSLSEWAERWIPEDHAAAQHDPDVVVFWLTLRVDPAALPDPQVVLVFTDPARPRHQGWLVLQRGTPPSICDEDPLLSQDRYIYVEGDIDALFPISRGLRDWDAAIADRSVQLYGDPVLISALPGWFMGADALAPEAAAPAAVAVA